MDAFTKYENNPVFGDKSTGTMFDAYVREIDGKLRMDVSWRPKMASAITYSDDGIHWTEPYIAFENNPKSGWEDNLNRTCTMKNPIGDGWLMWYTGQANNYSYIGVAKSDNGKDFYRFLDKPIISPETDFENISTMNPFVMYENGKFRMWYAAGESCEPNVICYAESDDGIVWNKYPKNPIFECNKEKEYEQNRIGAVDILKDEKGYLMFYIGYRDVNTACVCVARSKNGIDGWVRYDKNPLVSPTPGAWDGEACYKPTVVKRKDGTYMLWYNGRIGGDEFIGLAYGQIDL